MAVYNACDNLFPVSNTFAGHAAESFCIITDLKQFSTYNITRNLAGFCPVT